ncbi:MAG: riboflavin biosynthesis protein RibF [Bacteroidales bacterium]|nr:riboflavin biosynthesis protein RibF [Bacteroidales bacterium]
MVVAATGFFDGVHRGHARVIENLCRIAKEKGGESAVITFWPHPRLILGQDAERLRLLTSMEEKKALLRSMGVDHIHVIEFTEELSRLTSQEFIRQYLIEKYGVKCLVVGYDHKIGSDGKDVSIEQAAALMGVETIKINAVSDIYNTISSTYIRNLIDTGGIERANDLLGYRYALAGVVIKGMGNGKKIGFPTANISLSQPLKAIPEKGVYAVYVSVGGACKIGICNIGTRPTLNDSRGLTIETHIIDFDRDIYGLELKIEFIARLRDEIRFKSLDMLAAQLRADTEHTRTKYEGTLKNISMR